MKRRARRSSTESASPPSPKRGREKQVPEGPLLPLILPGPTGYQDMREKEFTPQLSWRALLGLELVKANQDWTAAWRAVFDRHFGAPAAQRAHQAFYIAGGPQPHFKAAYFIARLSMRIKAMLTEHQIFHRMQLFIMRRKLRPPMQLESYKFEPYSYERESEERRDGRDIEFDSSATADNTFLTQSETARFSLFTGPQSEQPFWPDFRSDLNNAIRIKLGSSMREPLKDSQFDCVILKAERGRLVAGKNGELIILLLPISPSATQSNTVLTQEFLKMQLRLGLRIRGPDLHIDPRETWIQGVDLTRIWTMNTGEVLKSCLLDTLPRARANFHEGDIDLSEEYAGNYTHYLNGAMRQIFGRIRHGEESAESSMSLEEDDAPDAGPESDEHYFELLRGEEVATNYLLAAWIVANFMSLSGARAKEFSSILNDLLCTPWSLEYSTSIEMNVQFEHSYVRDVYDGKLSLADYFQRILQLPHRLTEVNFDFTGEEEGIDGGTAFDKKTVV
jgi:hypothetical protein